MQGKQRIEDCLLQLSRKCEITKMCNKIYSSRYFIKHWKPMGYSIWCIWTYPWNYDFIPFLTLFSQWMCIPHFCHNLSLEIHLKDFLLQETLLDWVDPSDIIYKCCITLLLLLGIFYLKTFKALKDRNTICTVANYNNHLLPMNKAAANIFSSVILFWSEKNISQWMPGFNRYLILCKFLCFSFENLFVQAKLI